MPQWVPSGEDFDIGDVVRWTEAIWHDFKHQRRGKKRKTLKLGSREVMGQVTECDGRGFVRLSVMKCKILEMRFAKTVEPYKKDASIRRKRSTIARGNGERMVSKASREHPKKPLSKFQRQGA